MAEIFSTSFQDEALVLKSLIESTGIEVELAGEHTLNIIPLFFAESGGIRISVSDDDEEDAMAIVAQFLESRSAPSSTED